MLPIQVQLQDFYLISSILHVSPFFHAKNTRTIELENHKITHFLHPTYTQGSQVTYTGHMGIRRGQQASVQSAWPQNLSLKEHTVRSLSLTNSALCKVPSWIHGAG